MISSRNRICDDVAAPFASMSSMLRANIAFEHMSVSAGILCEIDAYFASCSIVATVHMRGSYARAIRECDVQRYPTSDSKSLKKTLDTALSSNKWETHICNYQGDFRGTNFAANPKPYD